MNLTQRSAAIGPGTLKARVAEIRKIIAGEARERPIILVFGLGSYGDVIQITPLLRALKGRFPAASLILVHHDAAGAKLIEHAPYLARYLRLPASHHYLLRTGLEPADYDLAVECRYVVKYTLSERCRLSLDEQSFVSDAQQIQKPWLKFVQNFPFDNDLLWREAKGRKWSMYDLMAHTSGFPGEDFEDIHLGLATDQSVAEEFSLPSRYAVVSNSAEWLPLQASLWTKCLPHAGMKEALHRLSKKGIPTVLLGTKNDPGDYAVDYDLRGKTNLLDAAHIIQKARVVLGPEGGLVNLAKAVGTPSVVFFGSTPVEFFRFKSNVNIEPRVCGGCWWSTASYLRQCPLLAEVPPCTQSLDVPEMAQAVHELFLRTS